MEIEDQNSNLTIYDIKNDKKKIKKWQKRVTKGEINVDTSYLMASKIYQIKGQVSLKFNKENQVDNHVHIHELRELLQSLSHHDSMVPRSFTLTNKAYVRRVIMIHFQEAEDPFGTLKELTSSNIYRLKISKHPKIPVSLPRKLLTLPYDECSAEELSLLNLPSMKKSSSNSSTNNNNNSTNTTTTSKINLERENFQEFILSPSLLSLWNYPLTIDYANEDIKLKIQSHNKNEKSTEDETEEEAPLKKVKLSEESSNTTEVEVKEDEIIEEYVSKHNGVLDGKIPDLNTLEILQKRNPSLFQPTSVYYYTDFPKSNELVVKDFIQSISENSEEYKQLWLNPVGKQEPLSFAAIDCEMVSTELGDEIARVTLINSLGLTIFDSYVKPSAPIKDYKTEFSGITPENLQNCTVTLSQIHLILRRLISKETILIGHSLDSDLKCLKFLHLNCIDSSILFPHSRGYPLRRKLKELAKEFLNISIQTLSNKGKKKGHDSQEDALAALNLVKYRRENNIEIYDDEAIIAGSDIGITPGISLLSRLDYKKIDCSLFCWKKKIENNNGKNSDPIILNEKYWIENICLGSKYKYQHEDNEKIINKFIQVLEKNEKNDNNDSNLDEFNKLKLNDYLLNKDNNKVSFSFLTLNASKDNLEQCKSLLQSLQQTLSNLSDSSCLIFSSQISIDPIISERQSKKVLMNSTQLTTSTWNPTREKELNDKIASYNQAAISFTIL